MRIDMVQPFLQGLVCAADIGFGVLPTTEFDGDPDSVIYEFDPFSVE
jgi:hypothetical protein